NDNQAVVINGKIVKDYSGRGTTKNGIIKPDLIAPATNIVSCAIGNKKLYTSKSGTSMAVPVVCGVIGLYLEHNGLRTNNYVKSRLKQTCADRRLPVIRQGAGLINPLQFLGI
ncbi:MAG: S8 family serine peptidase, partial [Lachnospiraceae bacterium]|nr:S8 family serine peptidase [Lachnospiraceae bacterium]